MGNGTDNTPRRRDLYRWADGSVYPCKTRTFRVTVSEPPDHSGR